MLRWFEDRGVHATVAPFRWSGRNSVAARQTAATALLKHIDHLRSSQPEAALHVVAHSHGGSVFAYALKERPALRERIDGFVALATPWIDVAPCDYGPALRTMLARVLLYAVFAICLWAVPTAVQQFAMPSANAQDAASPAAAPAEAPASSVVAPPVADQPLPKRVVVDFSWVGSLVRGLIQLAYSLLAAAGISVLFFLLQRQLSNRLASTLAAFRARTQASADRASTLRESMPPSVFLKPIGDEAALALTWTSAMAALSQGASATLFLSMQSMGDLWMRTPLWARLSLGLLLTAAWSMGTVMLTGVRDADGLIELMAVFIPEKVANITWYGVVLAFPLFWSLIAWLAAALWLLTTLALMLVAWLAAAGAGMPSLRAALYLRVSVEAVPAGTRQLVLVDVSSKFQGERVVPGRLSHSVLYESASAIEAVLTALDGFERGRGACREAGRDPHGQRNSPPRRG